MSSFSRAKSLRSDLEEILDCATKSPQHVLRNGQLLVITKAELVPEREEQSLSTLGVEDKGDRVILRSSQSLVRGWNFLKSGTMYLDAHKSRRGAELLSTVPLTPPSPSGRGRSPLSHSWVARLSLIQSDVGRSGKEEAKLAWQPCYVAD